MKSHVHFPVRQVALALFSLALIGNVACNRSQSPAAPSPLSSAATSSSAVFVIFEGPWALVDDPKDASSILALAPRTKIHSDLYVAASNESILAPGTYDLSVPAHGAAASGALDATFARTKISSDSLLHAINDKSGRYVIRLPKPEAYVAARRFVSRVGASYPPDASTEQNYATFVAMRYTVQNLSDFSIAGTPDTGTWNPLLLQLDTPNIRFAIEPSTPDDFTDRCHTHSRRAFRDTAKYLGLVLYVDFPSDSATCHNADPQGSDKTKADSMRPPLLERARALLFGKLVMAHTVNTAEIFPHDSLASFYLLHAADGSCKAPILFLTPTP